MNKLKIYPYKMASESAKDLASTLNCLRVKPDGKYVPKIGHTVVNWGSGKSPSWISRANARGVTILNKPEAVKIASNKLNALIALEEAGINVPRFTTDRRLAGYWLEDGETVVERHVLNGNSADGVRIVNLDDDEMDSDLRSAPLYTKFIPKSCEFRVHVLRGDVIDYCEKKKMSSDRRPENFNKYVCSNELGWVFCRSNIRDIPEVKQLAIEAVSALGLDFGAVDVVYHEGTPYVLEVNTAPGITGTTLTNYANAFRGFLGLPNLTENTSTPSVERESRESDFSSFSEDSELSNNTRSADDVDNTMSASRSLDGSSVTLTLDRTTARKLQTLLSSVL